MLHKLKNLTPAIMLASLSVILFTACGQEAKESYNTKTTGAATTTAPTANKEYDKGKESKEYDKGNSAAANTSPAADNKTAATDDAANQITIQNFAFKPANLTVAAGTKVTWTNKDGEPHTATATDKRFASNALDTGDQFSFVFTDKGDYSYFCTLHPQMKGKITVK